MSKGILDTNIIIHLPNLDPAVLPIHSAITTISIAELSAGVHAAKDSTTRSERLDLLQRTENSFDPLPFDLKAAHIYGRISAQVTAIGRSPRRRIADLMIAAIAASQGLPIYTTNDDDFKGLEGVVKVVPVKRPSLLA